MQTFLVSPNFDTCAKILDSKRLNKQITECFQILQANLSSLYRWHNHPACRMWKPYHLYLYGYIDSMQYEWNKRYKKVHKSYRMFLELISAIYKYNYSQLQEWHLSEKPCWFYDERIYVSHRSNLLRKKPEYYSQFKWKEPDNLPYFWPTKCGDYAKIYDNV